MNHRHCELPECYEIATQEVAVSRDSHQKYGWTGVKLWVCTDHIPDGIALCANRLLAGRYDRRRLVVE